MSLTHVLVLIGFAGLAAALWAMVRGFGSDAAAYRRRQKQAGLGLAGLLLGLIAIAAVREERVLERLTAPPVDGVWAAVRVDGQAVDPREWRFGITRGKVSGGRDGCNEWGYDEPEVEGGERTITTTLVGCPEDDPVRKAYWTLASAKDATLELHGERVLRIAARGHEAILRRCRWTIEEPPSGTPGTGQRICALE